MIILSYITYQIGDRTPKINETVGIIKHAAG
jgi:hypothetical protein